MDRTPASAYFDAAEALLKRVRDTQGGAIETAAIWCAETIARRWSTPLPAGDGADARSAATLGGWNYAVSKY